MVIDEVKEEMKEIAKIYFAPTLEREGFHSYKGEFLQWGRLREDVLQHIALTKAWRHGPFSLDSHYGVIPLFQYLPVPLGIYGTTMKRRNEEIMRDKVLAKGMNRIFKSSVTICDLVTDPDQMWIEKEFLPTINSLNTPKEAYEWHKQRVLDTIQKIDCERINYNIAIMNVFTTGFTDEVIFFEDQELYPYVITACKERAKSLPTPRELARVKRTKAENERFLLGAHPWWSEEHLTRQLKALCENDRSDFLAAIEKRAELNLNFYKKAFGF